MVIDPTSTQPNQNAGFARDTVHIGQFAESFSFWDRIPELTTERRIALLRWVVPISLSLITFMFEVREHWLEITVTPLAFTDFSREILLFGILWPLSAFLLLSWLLRQWRLRREASETLQQLYLDVSHVHSELATLDQQRMELLRRQVTIHEEERRHIAAEIHDEMGSLLTRISTDLERLRAVHACESTEFDRQVDDCRALVEATVDRAHNLCVSLRPLLLENLGLKSALRAEATNRLTPAGIAWQINLQGTPGEISPDIALVAFRIAQESFSNILRHAHATSVEVTLEHTEHSLKMRIVDNGVGLSQIGAPVCRHSLGLIGMRERAQAVGGSFAVRNAPGKGVEVIAQLPI